MQVSALCGCLGFTTNYNLEQKYTFNRTAMDRAYIDSEKFEELTQRGVIYAVNGNAETIKTVMELVQ